MAKIRRKCSKCDRTGHYKSTCKKKKKTTKKKKKTTKKKKKKRSTTTTKSTKSRYPVGAGKGWKLFQYVGTTKKGNLSHKTWGIKQSGKKVWTHHGRTWGIKKSTPKTFSTVADAKAFYARKIKEKRSKGYVLVAKNRRKRRRRR